MATTKSSAAPWFFNFLKEGLLLPTHNRKFFAAVFAVMVTSLLLLGNNKLAVQPLEDEIRLDTKALNSTDEPTTSPNYLHLLQEIKDSIRELWLTTRGVSLLVSSAVRILVLFAAVATYSGEPHTFASILGKAKARLKGPALTIAFTYALETAWVALIGAIAVLPAVLGTDVLIKQHLALLVVESLLFLVACFFLVCSLVYLSFLCSLSVLVAVAEPGCYGAGAVGRAWRLVKGKRGRAMLFILVTAVLPAVFSYVVQALGRRCALGNVAAVSLLRFLYTIPMAAEELFSICALTAFYFECKGRQRRRITSWCLPRSK